MLPDPADIGGERLGEAVRTLLEVRRVVEEDEVELGERLRHCLVVDATADDRGEALIQGGGESDLLERHLGSNRIRAQHEHDRVRAHDQGLDARPPVLEGVDLAAVDERLETSRLERGLQPVCEGEVLTGIGDEDLGFGFPAGLLRCRIVNRHE